MPGSARRPFATRKRAGGGFVFGVLTGLILGLGIALGIAFYVNKTPIPFLSAKPKQAERDASSGRPIAGLPQGSPTVNAPAESPKFDFYKILPSAEEPVSEKDLRERSRAAVRG
jgi:hypothetical protein